MATIAKLRSLVSIFKDRIVVSTKNNWRLYSKQIKVVALFALAGITLVVPRLYQNLKSSLAASPNAATFVSWNIPSSLTVGQIYSMEITMKNTGSTTWKNKSLDSNTFYGLTSWPWLPPAGIAPAWNHLPTPTVAPGQTVTFSFKLKAPSTPGTYNYQWKMLQQNVTWFDAMTPNASLVIIQPPVDSEAPTTPTNLKATPVSAFDIDVSWTASSADDGVAGYRVFRNGVQIADTDKTVFYDSKLTGLTAYSYDVLAYDTEGKASLKTPSITVTTYDAYGSTPIGPDTVFNHPTEGVQTMIYHIFHTPQIDRHFNFLTKGLDYIWLDQSSLNKYTAGVLDVPGFNANFKTYVTKLKNANNSLKVGAHIGGPGFLAPYHITYQHMAEEDFLHTLSGQRIPFNNDQRAQYINISSKATRQKIVNTMVNLFSSPGIDGLNLDGYYLYHKDSVLAGSCKEGPCNTKGFWESPLNNLLVELRTALNGDVTYNGLIEVSDPDTQPGELNSGFVDYADGVLVEHPHRMLSSPQVFEKYLQTIASVVNRGKKVFFWVQPQIAQIKPNDRELERYYLSAYLLIEQNPLTYFGYHPGQIYHSSKGVYYYSDWDLDYGAPLESYKKLSSGLFVRKFKNGIAVVNPTPGTLNYTFPDSQQYRLWDATNGQISSGTVSMPSLTGRFYFSPQTISNSAKFISWNMPTSLRVGQSHTMSVTFQNTGSKTWKNNSLDSTNYYGLTTWPWPAPAGITQVWNALPTASVAPGQNVTFTFNLKAPSTPGAYNYQWKMLQQNVEWFDATTPNAPLTVTP